MAPAEKLRIRGACTPHGTKSRRCRPIGAWRFVDSTRARAWRRYLKDDEWSAEDRQLLELADDARAEVQDTINMDAGDSERHGAEIIPWTRAQWRRDRRNCPRHGDACLGNCTVRDVARVILCHTMQELDGGVVGNVRRLIIGGFSQYVEPPEDEEWDIHFHLALARSIRCSANTTCMPARTKPVEAEFPCVTVFNIICTAIPAYSGFFRSSSVASASRDAAALLVLFTRVRRSRRV